jgi:murein endopeptidase
MVLPVRIIMAVMLAVLQEVPALKEEKKAEQLVMLPDPMGKVAKGCRVVV